MSYVLVRWIWLSSLAILNWKKGWPTMQLSPWQRVKRRMSLLGGSYTHPDGTIELDFDEKAGIDPTVDSERVQNIKLSNYLQRQQHRELRGTWFFWGLAAGIIACKLLHF
jgi:hypothetical protein